MHIYSSRSVGVQRRGDNAPVEIGRFDKLLVSRRGAVSTRGRARSAADADS
jgi:hypothetical protein